MLEDKVYNIFYKQKSNSKLIKIQHFKMLYFLYMTTLTNSLFHHELTTGTIEYKNRYPFDISKNHLFELSESTLQQNVTLLDAEKHTLRNTDFIGFTFDASDNVTNINDISRSTIGNAYYYKGANPMVPGTGRTVYSIKPDEYAGTNTNDSNYFGDLDYVKLSIPTTDISSIRQTIVDLSANITQLANNKPTEMTDITNIDVENIANDQAYVEYYFYVWEEINGPWFDGSTLSLEPNNTQLTDANYNIRPITFNDISNQEQIETSDAHGKKLHTYNYFGTNSSDTSSNYIRVFKITGVHGTNDGLPTQHSIVLTNPKYTKYNFLWTYSIKNSYNLLLTDNNSVTSTIKLEGYAPFYTPNLNIGSSGLWGYEYFSNIGSLPTHFATQFVERIYKATNPINLVYNQGELSLAIPDQDTYDLSENFINRYKPDDGREGNTFLFDAINREKYIHLYENNEILKIHYNIYVFINEDIQYGKDSNDVLINLSEPTSAQNQTSYPYGDTFTDISSNELIELSDNSVYLVTLNKTNINFGGVPYNGIITNSTGDISRNRYNNEDDNDSISTIDASNALLNDTIDKYFAYEINNTVVSGGVRILRVKRQDLINIPYYGHNIGSNEIEWDTIYKKYNTIPQTNALTYTMSSNKYDIRWNYSVLRYKYDKSSPIDFKLPYYEKTAFNSGISKPSSFDFTEFNKRVYPNDLLDISYTSLPHYSNGVDVAFYYKNLHVSLNQTIISRLSNNLFFNHNENVRAKINLFVLKPDTIMGLDQRNNYDTRDIVYDTFDLSFSFYDANKRVPDNVFIDISENGNENTLLAGQYIFEWNYEIIVDGGTDTSYLPFDKTSSSAVYTVNSTEVDIPYNDFLYDLSGIHVYSNANFTNLFMEFAQEDIARFVDYVNIYQKTLDKNNTDITFKFNLFTPNKEASQTSGTFWSLPPGYQGRDDPRLYQSPTLYIDKTVVPSPIKSYENENIHGDIGFDVRSVSYVNSTNEFYSLVKTYDISNTTTFGLENDISNNVSHVKNYIVEMEIPENTVNNDVSCNFGLGNIQNIDISGMITTKVQGVHLGMITPANNENIIYYRNGNSYYFNSISGETFSGKIRWLMEETSTGISVTISVNNKKAIYLQDQGVPATDLTFLGTNSSDISQNNSTIKVYSKRSNTNSILLKDISKTDIIFHQIRDPTLIGGTDTIPQSHVHTNSTFQIPYICRMDYEIHDKTNNFIFESTIRKKNKGKNNVEHRIQDYDISYNINGQGVEEYFFNKSAVNPFTHKYIYGVGFISPIGFDIIDFHYPGKLDLGFSARYRQLSLEITDLQLLLLTYNLRDLWNAINDNTQVTFRFYGWSPRSSKITNLISNGLDPNTANDVNSVITDLSGVDFDVDNVDFMYDIDGNTYYEFNFPQIPKTIFIIDENDLKSGIYYIGWTYIINNTWNINKIPPTRDYDLSLASIIIPTFQYKPKQVTMYIQEDLSRVELTIPEIQLIDMSNNLYFKNFEYSDISQINVNFYLWTPDNVKTVDNSNGWVLPNDYTGLNDIRIKQVPSIYYDQTEKINKVYDASYNGGYGIDKTKAHTKTLSGKNLYDLSTVVFTPADLGLDELPYSSRYNINGNTVPYIATWNYDIEMTDSSSYSNISIQSDISSSTDPTYIFRIPDWVIQYDSTNNASFENNIFNKYFYASGTLIEVIPPPPPQFIYNSDRCTLEGCPKLTTKTKENKNMNQRYSAAMNVDFRLASKINFDCGNK